LRDPLAEDLRASLWIQSLLALVLALLLLSASAGALVALVLVVKLPQAGLWPWLLPLGLLVGLDLWALRRSLKAANLLLGFGRWPAPLQGLVLEPGAAMSLRAAHDAFSHGDLERCQRLLDRLPGDLTQAPLRLARGRCLVLLGRMEEARSLLAQGGEAPYMQGWLKPRRWLWQWHRRPYLGEADARRALNTGPSGLAVLVLLLGLGGVAWPFVQAIQVPTTALARGFDVSGFEGGASGRIAVHYHDRRWANQVWDIADDALDQDLAFFNLPPDTFGARQIHLFLCDDQAEYMRRSPQPSAWEAACALPDKDAIFIYKLPPEQRVYFEIVMAHELSHLVYHKLGIKGDKDSWLNEGVADYLGYRYGLEKYRIPRQAWLMEHAFKDLRKHALPFQQFFQVEPHHLPDAEVSTFYMQGASMVYMLIENYGKEPFLLFMNRYASTGDINRSLAATYPTLPSVEALGAVWGLFFQQAESASLTK